MRRFLCLLAVLAAACAQLETPVPEDRIFQLTGRLAARQGDEVFSGNVSWRHAGSTDELLVTTPLGQGVARIVRRGSSVVLTTSEPREYRARDVASLTEKALGFRLPLEGLADWVRGRPSPHAPASVQKDPDGRIAAIEQSGWRIEYQAYEEDAPLPRRLRLTYPGIDLRLAVTSWQ